MEQLFQRTRIPFDILPPPSRYALDSIIHPRDISLPNVSPPTIRRTDSYEVNFHVARIKHKTHESCPTLYAIFDSFDSARSFHTDYRILAANVPQEITGQLHVIIQKD